METKKEAEPTKPKNPLKTEARCVIKAGHTTLRTLIQLGNGSIYALPMAYLTGAVYEPGDGREKVTLYWGGWLITIGGRGLKNLAGEITNASIEKLVEAKPDQAELMEGEVIEVIDVRELGATEAEAET